MSKKTIAIIVGILISLSVLALMIGRGYDGFVDVVQKVKVGYLFVCLLASVLAYFFIGLSLWEILRVLGCKIKITTAVGIAFVSTTVNYFISSMGVSGFALRAHLLDKRSVPLAKSVTASVVISVLLYMVLAFLVLQGSIFLFFNSHVTTFEILEGFFGVVILLSISFGFVILLFKRSLRSKFTKTMFRGINHVIYFFSGPMIPQEDFDHFERQLEEGVSLIHRKKHKLTRAVFYICADWIFTLLILYLGFKSVGVTISVGPLVSGFALGIITTLIPFLPGGLGAMELTMTAVFSGLGIDWNSALVACLIYRLCYYVIPSVISIIVYWGLKISEPMDLKEKLKSENKIIREKLLK
ncbi:MAG TPA: lysylphosphatidylglycerol synthase transmembrane domain-containing protein [Elusimicrobiales bacterium]|nr:lysylphosphatidylglycerol synthase transmembrane domain-containing protein [Elusimicrobiales bacterium]